MSEGARLGLFGGTFDPVHHGHLLQARWALERRALDEVWFIPCAQSPHKEEGPEASALERLRMLELAVEGEAGFRVCDWEVRKGPPSFSIETVERVEEMRPDASLFWLLGADQKPKLDAWHRIEAFRQKVELILLNRGSDGGACDVPGRLDLSATDIRARVRSGRSIRYHTPDAVIGFIEEKRLYRAA